MARDPEVPKGHPGGGQLRQHHTVTATQCQQHTGFQPLRKDIIKTILQMREPEVY